MPVETKKTEPLVVKADRGVKKLYVAALLALAAAKAAGSKAFHRRYEIVTQIIEHDPPLYLAGSFATATEFIKSELRESPQSVHRNLRIIKLATPDEINRYSATRIHFAIVYFEAKTQTSVTQRGAINFKTFRVAIKRDGKAMNLPLDQVSYAEIQAAIADLAPPKKSTKTEVGKAVEAAIKRIGVKGISVTVTKTKFSVRGPLSGLAAVGRALAEVDVPTG